MPSPHILGGKQEDVDYNLKTWNSRFAEYMNMTDWNQSDCWYAHCCMLNDDEQKMLAANKIGIAHCPSSNLRLASGIAPIRRGSGSLSGSGSRSGVLVLVWGIFLVGAFALVRVWRPCRGWGLERNQI